MRRISKRLIHVLTVCAMVLSFMLAGTAVGYADSPIELSMENVKVLNACDVEIDGNKLIVTDVDPNPDVWSSRLLMDSGLKLTPGEQYKISFNFTGENGVGEFFLCKGENIDVRYDETFTSEEGNRSITFTAFQSKLFIGIQAGNIGLFNSLTAEITDICKLSESEYPELLRTENCTVSVENGVITATDTSDNNDVWNSKLLYDPGVDLEIGKTYELNFKLSGDNGVGEFFLCKSQDLNDRYDETFVNAGGSRKVSFKAESEKLYVGMQFGNIGKDNTVTASIGKVGPSTDDPNAVNCTYIANDGELTVIDLGYSNDVWDSKLIYDAGLDLEVGKKYEIQIQLSGDNGAGEFFLCKSQDVDDRYDETFFNANGLKTVVFTATSPKAYLGMQVGNLGVGNQAKVTVSEAKLYDESAPKPERLLQAENCTYEISKPDADNPIATDIKVVDTEENNDIWNSKLLYCLGEILDKGKFYAANFNLSGDNGVGEFFFCKKDNLDDRYSFDNTVGDHTAKFTAEDAALYAGYQFGNIGNENESTVSIFDIFRIPQMMSSEGCFDSYARDSITLTDDGDNDDVWNSKAVFATGIILEPGKTYTAKFTLTGDNGVGEFFFLKSNDIDKRYSFDNTAGEHTISFTADDDAQELYFGIQCGNIGNGNKVTVSNISITPVDDVQPAEEPAEQPAEEPAEQPAEEPAEQPAEEPAEQPAEEPVEQPVEENKGE